MQKKSLLSSLWFSQHHQHQILLEILLDQPHFRGLQHFLLHLNPNIHPLHHNIHPLNPNIHPLNPNIHPLNPNIHPLQHNISQLHQLTANQHSQYRHQHFKIAVNKLQMHLFYPNHNPPVFFLMTLENMSLLVAQLKMA